MSIDAVIAQARRPGSFSERRRFTIARTQAIQKLRQFALADPSAYVLELIQAAIGNGAVWIDIQRAPTSMTLAYIGGGLPESALTRLFDYLFAGKDRTDIGHLRDLAHGVNALLALGPSRIVVESGDGTREGTTRLEIERGQDRFDVGRPDHTLAGTFIRAEGMSGDNGRERGIVEARCRMAPIPMVYDGESLFGFGARRIPTLPGFARTVSFDEGDLYGILGHDPSLSKPTVALLTRGVVIEEVEQSIGNRKVGGVINFDGLHKSADHARIVRDERLEEMWLRVRPYGLTLGGQGSKKPVETLQVRPWEGPPLTTMAEIRAWLHAAKRVVLVPLGTEPGSLAGEVAAAIAEALGARVLGTADSGVHALRLLGGSNVDVFHPNLSTSVDLEFYTQAAATPPPRPWVAQPVEVPTFTVAELAPQIVAAATTAGVDEVSAHELVGLLGESSELRARVYTPADADDPTTAEVRLHVFDRLLHAGRLRSRHAGHVLVAELPNVSASVMHAPLFPGGPTRAAIVATALLVHTDAVLAEAATRALAGVGHREGPLGVVEAHRVLELLARIAVLQLRHRVDEHGASRPTVEFALLEPGPPGVDLLDLPVLATHAHGHVSLRTLAADMSARGGLVFVDPSAGGLTLQVDRNSEGYVRALVGETALVHDPGRRYEAVDAEGRRYTREQVRAALAGGRIVAMHASRIADGGEGEAAPGELYVAPSLFLALAGPLVSAFDFEFDEAAFVASAPVRTPEVDGVIGIPRTPPPAPAVLVLDEGRGCLHRYVELASDYGVVGVLRLRAPPWRDEHASIVAAAVATATGELYQQVLARLPTLPQDGQEFVRAAAAVLGYAGRRIALVADPHGRVHVVPTQTTADRVLALPLFPGRRGLPLAAWHLVRRFAESGGDPAAALAEVDRAALPPVLSDWLAACLDPARIAAAEVDAEHSPRAPQHLSLRRDGTTVPLPEKDPRAPLDDVTLATTLETLLHTLRTDLPQNDRPWDRRGRVRILIEGAEAEDEFAAVEGDARTWILTLHPDHWLLRWASKIGRRDREPIAWLLLACYARINEHFDEVTNHHEGQFQRAVADALELGRLDLVTPLFE